MIAFICLFFPAVISVWIYELLIKKNLTKRQLVFRFCFNTVIINGVCFAAKAFLLSTGGQPLYTLYTDTTPGVAVRYLIMALPVCIVLSLVQIFLTKNVKVTVNDENEDKEDGK